LLLLSGDEGVTNHFLVRGRTDNPCWFKEHVPPQNAAWFFTQIEIFSSRNEGWFIRLQPSDEMFCRGDILTYVSGGPYTHPCKLPSQHLSPPLSSCYSSWITKRDLFVVKVTHILHNNLKNVSGNLSSFAIGTLMTTAVISETITNLFQLSMILEHTSPSELMISLNKLRFFPCGVECKLCFVNCFYYNLEIYWN
jgi:hypothetical protein